MDITKLKIKDEAYTGDEFELRKDSNQVLYTYPKPLTLSEYYNFGDYISHQSEKKSIINKVYNLVKKRMFQTKLKRIKDYTTKLNTVLDYGCGTGDFVEFLNHKQISAEGFEPTPLAYQKALSRNIPVYNKKEQLGSGYDVITLFHVLEHVEDYQATIAQLKEILKPEGNLVIAVPNYNSYDAKYYREKWAAWDVPRHLWHFSKQNIKHIAQQNELEVVDILPMPFDAYYISMISESYKGNPKVLGLWRGWLSNLKAKSTKEYSSNMFILRR
ncbi:class I SAM-dependent methyltransferase [Psychroflexus tropicus]|uniref:class I SAM-dependent methyltransferase n=1 Tax=Psychroflexus tropicus TaxID=197345 RepID=UPI0003A9EB5B|nr:class I SAM-dependent methyltransferase [Psychroflexus tropicus]